MVVKARDAGAVGLLLVAALLAVLMPTAAAAADPWATEERSFVDRINTDRQAAGLQPLAVNVDLVRMARDWSQVMAAEDTMYHNPLLAEQAPQGWQRLGENVGYTTNNSGAPTEELVARLHQAFLDSEGHRANILGDYSQVGVGVVMTAVKMWVTVDFMLAPLPAASPSEPAPVSSPVPRPPAPAQVDEAIGVSRDLFAAAGSAGSSTRRQATHVVLARAELFADALGGAGLAGDSAPVLFTPGSSPAAPDPGLEPAVAAEIDRVLGGAGTVYVLGGSVAVSEDVVRELAADGYRVRRLAGPSRVETSVAVAREVLALRGRSGEVLIARASDWADAVTGGAYAAWAGSPVLLTDRSALHPAVDAFLNETRPGQRWALGGRAALGDEVAAAAGAQRVAGPDRVATAVAIAQRLWGRTVPERGDEFALMPAYADNGWAYALAYAPWSGLHAAPQLLVGERLPDAVRDYLAGLDYARDAQAGAAAASLVPAPLLDEVLGLLGG
ncbi:MAG TPA: cell wall-binding repeat-containing protein [Egibacteraceae bacterium]|nr:cell wall-binding repeat-containing protein [Egibacteraceae bacterium]